MKELNQYILEKFKISKNIKNQEITLKDIEEVIDNYFKKNLKDETYYISLYAHNYQYAKSVEDIEFIQITIRKDENLLSKVSQELFKEINNIYPLKDEIDISKSRTLIFYYPKDERT